MFHAINFLTPVAMVVLLRVVGIDEFRVYFSKYLVASVIIGSIFLLFMPTCLCINLLDKIVGSLVLAVPLSGFFISIFFIVFFFSRNLLVIKRKEKDCEK